MYDPKSFRSSDQVFYYDLYGGAIRDNDKGVLLHLETLRKEAPRDGDVVFSLPDNSRIWTHSILFYIAAEKKLLSDFGTPHRLDPSSDAVETASNDLGVSVTVLFVAEDNQSAFKKVMNSCYTINSLSGIWEAMGYPVGFNEKEFRGSTLEKSTLPTSMLPDFEIHLKEPKTKSSLFSVKVHKFLLARRIPYYETFFASGFGDASGMTSTLYTEEFTVFSLVAIASFVYHEKPSSIFECYPNLRDYIAPSPVAPNQSPCCASFGTSLPIPTLEIADKLLEIAKSAHYLQATNLEKWAHYFLCELGHQFQCQGRGCVEFVPHILNLVADNEITDQWIVKKGISLLAQHKSISIMWKRPLLNCNPSVLESLIREVQNLSEKEDEKGRIIQLFVRLSNLRRLTSTSKNSSNWDRKLIVPLMDHTAEVIAKRFDDPSIISGLTTLFRGMNFSRPIGEELLERIVDNKMLGEENCRQIFVGIMTLARSCGCNTPEVEQAKMKCIAWFERKWVTLSLIPAPKAFGSVAEILVLSPPSNQRNPPHTSSKDKGKGKVKNPSTTTVADEGNFFSTWKSSEVEELAKELPASVSDLLATSHRKRPPVDNRHKSLKPMKAGKFGASGAAPRGDDSRGGDPTPVSDIGSVSDTGADRGSNMNS